MVPLEALISMGDNNHHITLISHDPREDMIRALAGRQAGHISRAQLVDLGLSQGAITARIRTGALVRRYPGVYALPPARHDPPALIAAAVLAGGPTAAASHTSAGYLWEYLPHYQPPPEITLPTGDRRPRHIHTHRCLSLEPRDVTRQRGIPTTTRARTLLDLAPALTHKQLTRLANHQLREKLIRHAALDDVLTRNPRHPGTKLLTPFLDLPGINPTASHLEDLFLAFIKKHGLPTPVINYNLRRKQSDAYFPEHNLIVELDGWEYHKDHQAFEDDRERDAENLLHGTPTIRITDTRLTTDDDREATRLQQILDQCLQNRRKPPSSQSDGLEEG